MIHFRFHLVSLVAVFLALALGVVMGAASIDRGIADTLRQRIEVVGENAERRRDENRELERQVADLRAFVEQAVPFVTARRLTDLPVALVAVRGVDPAVVRETVLALRASGARVGGAVWLEPALVTPDAGSRSRLVEVLQRAGVAPELGVASAVGPAEEDAGPEAELARTTVRALARRLARATEPSPAESRGVGAVGEGPSAADDLLSLLVSEGFLSLDAVGGPEPETVGYPVSGSRLVVVDGVQGRVAPLIGSLPLVRELAAVGTRVVLAEASDPAALRDRGRVVASVRDDGDLAARVGTVDGLDEIQGRVALVLALDRQSPEGPGHLGRARGASRQLPDPLR